jgi:hypothetical protein
MRRRSGTRSTRVIAEPELKPSRETLEMNGMGQLAVELRG